MKNHLRQKFKKKQTTFGMWATLADASVSEIAVTLGLDWVGVEMEHAHLSFGDVMNHIRTVRGATTAVLVRVTDNQQGLIKRVLDMGAHGLLVPLIRSGKEAEQAMQYGRYPLR